MYSKVYNTFSFLSTYIFLWSSHLINSVKKISSRTHSKKSPYFDSKTRSSLRDKVTTSTTITSQRRIVTTYIESTLFWYEKKRAQSPFLWGWLPLFLLLLIPFLGKFLRHYFTISRSCFFKSSQNMNGSNSKLGGVTRVDGTEIRSMMTPSASHKILDNCNLPLECGAAVDSLRVQYPALPCRFYLSGVLKIMYVHLVALG